MVTITLQAVRLKRAMLDSGLTAEQFQAAWRLLVLRGWIDKTDPVTLWATKPVCLLHPKYAAIRPPRSTRKGCNCKLVWEAAQ